MRDGIIFVQSWTGTESFVVTTPTTGERAPQQDRVLRADGSIETLDNLVRRRDQLLLTCVHTVR